LSIREVFTMTDTQSRERAHLEYPYGQDGQASNDEEILAAVLNALHHNSGIPSEHIRAEVKGGHVVLCGVVCQDYERALAEQAAASAPGVTKVENHLTFAS
jgi:osmotically-inducible protein OsmY